MTKTVNIEELLDDIIERIEILEEKVKKINKMIDDILLYYTIKNLHLILKSNIRNDLITDVCNLIGKLERKLENDRRM